MTYLAKAVNTQATVQEAKIALAHSNICPD